MMTALGILFVLTHTLAPVMSTWLLAPLTLLHSVIVKTNNSRRAWIVSVEQLCPYKKMSTLATIKENINLFSIQSSSK